MDGNTILIIGIILLTIVAAVFYYKNLSKVSSEIESKSEYTVSYLVSLVRDTFTNLQKTNLRELNLSRREMEAEQRKKLKTTSYLKTAAYGDSNAKSYIKDCIREILLSQQGNISPETIELVIPFSRYEKLSIRDKTDILFYVYYKAYGADGFSKLVEEYDLVKQNITDDTKIEYEITESEIDEVCRNVLSKISLSFEDKLTILVDRIFADYKGFGPVDKLFDFSIDEIDCGTSGVAQGEYELKNVSDKIEYSHQAVWIVFKAINLKLSFIRFASYKDLVRVCQNIYKFSAPYALSRKTGEVVGTMKDGSRIAVTRPPVGNSWGFWARKFDSAPSGALPEDLIRDADAFIPITISKWIMKTCRSCMVTGGMGSGKTTYMRSIIGYIPTRKTIRVYEISPELNLQFTYPKRNIFNFSITESVDMQTLYDFGKKCNANINIVGEVASGEMACIFIQSATVGSEMALGTHHAKTAEDLVLALRDSLTTYGGYSSEKVAEETVARCLNFNIHFRKEGKHRFIERITEIVPVREHEYPCDKSGEITINDQVTYYKRMTDRQSFKCVDIVKFRNGHYVFENPISDEMHKMMIDYLSEEPGMQEEFSRDMEMLSALLLRKE